MLQPGGCCAGVVIALNVLEWLSTLDTLTTLTPDNSWPTIVWHTTKGGRIPGPIVGKDPDPATKPDKLRPAGHLWTIMPTLSLLQSREISDD